MEKPCLHLSAHLQKCAYFARLYINTSYRNSFKIFLKEIKTLVFRQYDVKAHSFALFYCTQQKSLEGKFRISRQYD